MLVRGGFEKKWTKKSSKQIKSNDSWYNANTNPLPPTHTHKMKWNEMKYNAMKWNQIKSNQIKLG